MNDQGALSSQQQLEEQYLMNTYQRRPLELTRGDGIWLTEALTERRLRDFLSGIGAVCLGHADPQVAAAIARQAEQLVQVSNYFYIPGRGELGKTISLLLNNENPAAPPYKTFFCNSGAEANEGAFKLARKYGKLHLNGAHGIVSVQRSFHGRTLATTAATGQPAKQEMFAPMPAGFVHVAANDLAALQAALDKTGSEAVCALVLECIQGEGGVWPLDGAYIQAARQMTAERDILLIIDEVQTGFCRTGAWFAFQHQSIVPDVVTMAKGIANGFPMGALAACGKAAEVFVPGEHGSTFGGNSLAIAAATATIEKLKSIQAKEHAAQLGSYFAQQLATLPAVAEVRGQGLMQGISLSLDKAGQPLAAATVDEMYRAGFIVANIGPDILRFLPPLIVTKDDIDALIVALRNWLGAKC